MNDLTNFHLNWADKAALVVAAVTATALALLCAIAFIAVGAVDYIAFDTMLLSWSVTAVLAVTVPVWLVLRGVDLARRSRRREVRRPRQANTPAYARGMNAQMGWR